MEHRLYFMIGDLLACLASGIAGAWLAQMTTPSDLPAVAGLAAGMAIGMLLGMVAGIIFGTLLSPLFGAFEVSLPAGLAGMLGGMAAGMLAGMAGPDVELMLIVGGGAGLFSLLYCYTLQARLAGEAE